MRARGADEQSTGQFAAHFQAVAAGALGTIPEDSIVPLDALPAMPTDEVDDDRAAAALRRVAVVKLNGGLGTTMGLDGPKSILPVRDGLSFLDVIARQVLRLRARYAVDLPVTFMNSFRTRDETLAALTAYPSLAIGDVPLDFLQGVVPKLKADTLAPVDWPANPELEWCPAGHGDVYAALSASGLVQQLRDQGIRYAFISNADNLGATCDPAIAAWLVAQDAPLVVEACARTANDRKGGHFARRQEDGRLILRELAMVSDADRWAFADISRHRFFNANNLWVRLDVLADLALAEAAMPVIINRKTVDPTDPLSTRVIQLESAMGAAVESVEGAQAMLVPRSRFRPVKTTADLLLLRSDRYRLDADGGITAVDDTPDPRIDLSAEFVLIDDFEARFPRGVPQLRQCTSFELSGDVVVGGGVVCIGDVVIDATREFHTRHIPDGAVLR